MQLTLNPIITPQYADLSLMAHKASNNAAYLLSTGHSHNKMPTLRADQASRLGEEKREVSLSIEDFETSDVNNVCYSN